MLFTLSHNGWTPIVGEYRRIRLTPYIDCIKHLYQQKQLKLH
jgi:hypothetical protein